MSGSQPQPVEARLPPVAAALWWLLPVAFLVFFYRDGLSTWFVADDFAWLSLLHLARIRHDLLHELFAPMAQGTIRPWSERGFFMLLESVFGLDALPFRLVVFTTAAADVVLISWLTLRATGSRVAGFVAPILWTVNTALVRPMTWNSTFNEVLCPLFLLGALSLYIRYLDTGQRRFWWWQLVVFSLGFGALEINIVYPAIAAAWVLFSRDPKGALSPLTKILPLAVISALYFLLHRLAAPIPASGPYALFFDRSVLKTLALYWEWSLVPEAASRFGHSHLLVILAFLTGTLAITAFVATQLSRRRPMVLFFLSWFALTLFPVLPLTNHRTDYYLTIPVIGLAMLAAAAAGQYWNRPFLERALMVIPLGAYLFVMSPVTRAVTHWWLGQSLQVRTLVLGVSAARQTHPGKVIVINGVTTDLFDLSLAHSAFYAVGIDNVYLTPESALIIHPEPDTGQLRTLIPAPEALWHAITHDEVVVYSLESGHLRNITEGYTRKLSSRTVGLSQSAPLPSHVDVGNTLYSWLLGPSWLPPEDGVRWMPGSATLRLGVPEGGTSLELEGNCPQAQLLVGPRHLMVLVDGVIAGDTRIYDPESSFRRLFPMPAILAGKKVVDLEIRVDPVDRKDGQDYGLVFGNIAIRP